MINAFEQDTRTSTLVMCAATNADTPKELHMLTLYFAMAQGRTAKICGTITYPSETIHADRMYQTAGPHRRIGP